MDSDFCQQIIEAIERNTAAQERIAEAQERVADELKAIRELQAAWRQENIRNTQTAQAWHQEDVLRAELRDQMSEQQREGPPPS